MKYIPKLTQRELDRIDSLVALRQQLIEEKRITNDSKIIRPIDKLEIIKPINKSIIFLNKKMIKISKNYSDQVAKLIRDQVARLIKIYDARRWFALHLRHLPQIPSTRASLKYFIKAGLIYLWTDLWRMPGIWWHAYFKLSDLQQKLAKILILAILIVLAMIFIVLNNVSILLPDKLYVSNNPPQITSVPVDTCTSGNDYSYQVIATDPEGQALIYFLEQSSLSSTLLSIDSTSGFVSASTTDSGTVNVKITVKDPLGAKDTQQYTLTIF